MDKIIDGVLRVTYLFLLTAGRRCMKEKVLLLGNLSLF